MADLRDPEQLPGVSRATGVDLAEQMQYLYGRAEWQIAQRIARDLAAGQVSPRWALDKLLALGQLNDWIRVLLRRLSSDVADEIRYSMLAAYMAGGTAATRALAESSDTLPEWITKSGVKPGERIQALLDGRRSKLAAGIADLSRSLPGIAALQRMIGSLALRITGTHLPVLRWADDAYRQVVAESALTPVLLGTTVRRAASQHAWEQLLSEGITGFVDKAGRRWNLATYVEMATRSGVAQAAIEGHLDRLADAGLDLVIVSNAPQECERCLIPGTVVSGPEPTWRTRLEYTGDVIRIATASGKNLTGTPNHPVLTAHGWRRLDQVHPGDQVVSHSREQLVPGVVPDDVQVPTLIENAGESRAPLLLPRPAGGQLNGDAADCEVHAELPDGYLLSVLDSPSVEPLRELLLVLGIGTSPQFLGLLDLLLVLRAERDASGCLMCWREHAVTLLGGGVLPSLQHGLGYGRRALLMRQLGLVSDDAVVPGASLDAGAPQIAGYAPAADAENGAELLRALTGQVPANEFRRLGLAEFADLHAAAGGLGAPRVEALDGLGVSDAERGHELLEGFTGQVSLDEIVDVSVSHYSGHVWDLSTAPGWFLANDIVTHNCRPWEGKVLTRTGMPGQNKMTVEHAITGDPTEIEVAGTVAEAILNGLMHPNCRHSLSAFLPGVTRIPTGTADPEGDAARQRLRALERKARKQKLAAAAVIDPAAKPRLDAAVRATQKLIREHVKATAHLGIKRKPERERPDLGNSAGLNAGKAQKTGP